MQRIRHVTICNVYCRHKLQVTGYRQARPVSTMRNMSGEKVTKIWIVNALNLEVKLEWKIRMKNASRLINNYNKRSKLYVYIYYLTILKYNYICKSLIKKNYF